MSIKRKIRLVIDWIVLSFLLVLVVQTYRTYGDWKTARRDSANIAPDPKTTHEAVMHIYGADAWSWRGWFAIHTWIAAKRTGQDHYTVYDVVGWRSRQNKSVMQMYPDVPDRYWYGEKPELIKEYRGKDVDHLIDLVEQAAQDYPWKYEYSVFPGPNSNTFVGWIARTVPELNLELPLSAIGSDYE